MFQENEIVMLSLCLGVLIFITHNRKKLAKFRGWRLLFTSFVLLLTACVATVAEGFIMEDFFNYIEHICYAVSGITLATWFYKGFREKSDRV